LDDFHFVFQDRILHVCNVPSPAATASLVIGREIVSTLEGNADFKRMQITLGHDTAQHTVPSPESNSVAS
jgi:hypothetical protein